MVKLSDVTQQSHLLKNHTFLKRLGQNFILDINILDKIIDCAGDIQGANVLEIGSGIGSLSHRIVLRHPKIFTILEKDPRCVEAVKSWLDVDIRECDALDIDYLEFLKPESVIIANLPYSVATEILMKICIARSRVKKMVLMFQKEVAERIVAESNTKAFGRLAVIAQTCFDCKIIKILPPSVFIPAPKVYSALVTFVPKETDVNLEKLAQVTHIVFSKRRKMLRQSFNEEFLIARKIAPTSRAETLSVEEFHRLIKV